MRKLEPGKGAKPDQDFERRNQQLQIAGHLFEELVYPSPDWEPGDPPGSITWGGST